MWWPDCRFWRKTRVAWTAASAPKGTPYISWCSARGAPMAGITRFSSHLAAKRQSVHPTAISLTLLPFLFRAIRVAPQRGKSDKGCSFASQNQIDIQTRWGIEAALGHPPLLNCLSCPLAAGGTNRLGCLQNHKGRNRWLWPLLPWTPVSVQLAL